MSGSQLLFQAAVEGDLDEAVLRRIVRYVGADLATVYGREGKQKVKSNIQGYNYAARYGPWVVLVDLDTDHACAPVLCSEWLASPAQGMCFRVAVREVEAWLLADRAEIARFLGVSLTRIPLDPESLDDPKRVLVNAAARSSKRAIREGLVPKATSGREVGRLYTPMLRRFVETAWRPDVAAGNADSLLRCVAAFSKM